MKRPRSAVRGLARQRFDDPAYLSGVQAVACGL